MTNKAIQRNRRHRRIRARIKAKGKQPYLCVFRSNQFIYAQVVDNASGNILCYARGSKDVKSAQKVGESIAQKALEKKISKISFDRGGYKYHGRIKALAEGARAAGLKF